MLYLRILFPPYYSAQECMPELYFEIKRISLKSQIKENQNDGIKLKWKKTTENYIRGLQVVLYVKCNGGEEIQKFDIGNNSHMPSIFIEQRTTFHEVKCRYMKHNFDSQTNIDMKSIHPKIIKLYNHIIVSSYYITNKTDNN